MLPVTIIGGYLGAGKTTLVNAILRHANGRRIAVLVNEFGALPIDEDLIEAQDDAIISIAGGCVCCSYGNDLIQAMLDLGALDPTPDHVVLEASGVALPGAIAASVSLLSGYRFDGTVLVADAETIRTAASDPYMGDTVERQLADADIVLLNKVDLVDPLSVAETETWLATKSAQAAIVQTTHCTVPNAVVLQDFAPDPARLHAAQPHQIGQFKSAFVEVSGVVDADVIAQALTDPSLHLIRAKGFVKTQDGPRTVQVVGRRWAVSLAPPGAQPGIVVIAAAAQLDVAKVTEALMENI